MKGFSTPVIGVFSRFFVLKGPLPLYVLLL